MTRRVSGLAYLYGTNQEHLEPDGKADIPVPVPTDRSRLESIGKSVIESIEALERSATAKRKASKMLEDAIAAATENKSERKGF